MTNTLDQFFLSDKKVLQKLIEVAAIKDNDTVLEIGAGKGMVTRELAKKAKKVLAVEIDEQFKPDLEKLPKNVEVIFEDFFVFWENKERLRFNKVVSNLPSSLVEPVMHKFTSVNFEMMVLLVPLIFVAKLTKHPFFGAYYEFELIEKVGKESFSPQPKTNWAIIKITKRPPPASTQNWSDYLVRFVYEHEQAKLKNSLMEAVIRIYKLKGKALTKNQARKIIEELILSPELLANQPDTPEAYVAVRKVADIFSQPKTLLRVKPA